MINLEPFKDFFSSLSKITRLNIQVWDGKGLVFSSGPDQAASPFTKEIEDLSTRILSLGAPQNASYQGHHTICGVPLRTAGDIVGALIAYSSDSEKNEKPKKTYFANPLVQPGGSRQTDMEETQTLLNRLAGLMEEMWVSQEESEEMAEELSKHFEDLYLYSRVATQIKTLRFSNAMLIELIKEILETMRADLAFARLPGRKEYDAFMSVEGAPEKGPALESGR